MLTFCRHALNFVQNQKMYALKFWHLGAPFCRFRSFLPKELCHDVFGALESLWKLIHLTCTAPQKSSSDLCFKWQIDKWAWRKIYENIWKWNVNVLLWNRISWMLFMKFMFMDSLFHTNRVHGADMKSMPSIPPRRLRSKFGRVEGCYMLHRLGMQKSRTFFWTQKHSKKRARNKKTCKVTTVTRTKTLFRKTWRTASFFSWCEACPAPMASLFCRKSSSDLDGREQIVTHVTPWYQCA